tara:strand:+ start:2686 stop:2949 length:264 start_codon:yes stop_codon:yes gene_type:complete
METTTIQIDKVLKEKLESIKLYQRETFNELISRLIDSTSLDTASRESLIATVEVMSDPELMRGIKEGLQEEGGTPLEEFEKELGLNV